MYKVEDEILLASDLYPLVIDGTKEVTLRKGKRIFAPELKIVNRDNTVQHAKVAVTSVEYSTLANVGEETLTADGFGSVEEAVELMKRFYPDITADTDITVVRFKLTGYLYTQG